MMLKLVDICSHAANFAQSMPTGGSLNFHLHL